MPKGKEVITSSQTGLTISHYCSQNSREALPPISQKCSICLHMTIMALQCCFLDFFCSLFSQRRKGHLFCLACNLQIICDLHQHHPAFQKQHVSSMQETKWSLNQCLRNSSSSLFAKAQFVWGFPLAKSGTFWKIWITWVDC